MLYCGSSAQKAVKQTWTEHQDDELRTLFDEFHQLTQDTAAEHGLLLGCIHVIMCSAVSNTLQPVQEGCMSHATRLG